MPTSLSGEITEVGKITWIEDRPKPGGAGHKFTKFTGSGVTAVKLSGIFFFVQRVRARTSVGIVEVLVRNTEFAGFFLHRTRMVQCGSRQVIRALIDESMTHRGQIGQGACIPLAYVIDF